MKTLFLMVFCVALMGCGTMNVQVDIYNRTTNSLPFILPGVERQEQRINARVLAGRYEKDRGELVAKINSAITAGVNSGTLPQSPATVASKLASSAEVDIDTAYLSAEDAYGDGLTAMASFRKTKPNDRETQYAQIVAAKDAFDRGDKELSKVRTKVLSIVKVLEQQTGSPASQPATARDAASQPQTLAQAVQDLNNANDSATGDLIGNNGLFEDVMASAVVGAPEKFWIKKYNQTFGFGLIGNTDLAVQMNSLGDFTIKGARTDSANATTATFDGLRMAVSVAAAASGIPVPLAKASPSSPASATSQPAPLGGDIQQANQDVASAGAAKALARVAEINILEAIVSQRSALDSSNPTTQPAIDQRKQAVQVIQSVFSANRANLVPAQAAPK